MKKREEKRLRAAALAALIVSGAACAGLREYPGGGFQTGIASWYGPDFHGRPTSNKEIYDMYDMTAAHNTLPFGTMVMVTNLDNGKTAIVRINDRGPFVGERIIDLSYAAARVLDIVGPGTARVRLEVLRGPLSGPRGSGFSVQVGSFISPTNAEALRKKLRGRYNDVYISRFKTSSGVYFRVRLKAEDRGSALNLARRLLDDGYPVIVLEER